MEKYNWWTDPKNEEEVKRISWWDHEENKETFPLPISVVESEGMWTATCNKGTEKYLGERLHGCSQGKTKQEAIKKMFQTIRITHYFSEERMRMYECWVPFIKGDWNHTGGKWLTVFGIHIYFRHGSGMKGGRYIPFTNLNISVSNKWANYRRWKKENKP